MEHPVAGLQIRRGNPKTIPSLHGGTSLKLSDAGPSPVLEAHPGSPVDLTSARRPSLAASLATARSYDSNFDVSRSPRSPKTVGKTEESFRGDGVAAKALNLMDTERTDGEVLKSPRRPHVVGMQPFFIPAKVPEDEEVRISTTSLNGDDVMSISTTTDVSEMDFEFETDDSGTWISANPLAHESKSSLATTTTAASTLIDERFGHGALTIDTSIASSAASMMSSSASSYSATANMSDIYGWEEELDRKSSIENHNNWEREMARRLPSGGRTFGPRVRVGHELHHKRGDVKRKSLLYRVLNLSGRRGAEDSNGSITPPEAPFPTTSPSFN